MLHAVRPAVGRVLDPVARGLVRAGVSANAVTVVGTAGVVAGAVAFYPRGRFFVGTLVITAFVFNDLLDGAVARAGGGSEGAWGAFLDSSLDRFGDAAVFGTLALWFAGGGHSLVMSAVCVYALAAAMLTSYVKARAEGLGFRCDVGLVERPERLIAVLAATGLSGLFGVPALQVVVLWLLAAAMTVTVGQRFLAVHRQAVLPQASAPS